MTTIIKSLKKIYSASDENRRVILKLLERNSKAKICDLGCGSGDFTTEVTKTIEAAEVIGLDLEQEISPVIAGILMLTLWKYKPEKGKYLEDT